MGRRVWIFLRSYHNTTGGLRVPAFRFEQEGLPQMASLEELLLRCGLDQYCAGTWFGQSPHLLPAGPNSPKASANWPYGLCNILFGNLVILFQEARLVAVNQHTVLSILDLNLPMPVTRVSFNTLPSHSNGWRSTRRHSAE